MLTVAAWDPSAGHLVESFPRTASVRLQERSQWIPKNWLSHSRTDAGLVLASPISLWAAVDLGCSHDVLSILQNILAANWQAHLNTIKADAKGRYSRCCSTASWCADSVRLTSFLERMTDGWSRLVVDCCNSKDDIYSSKVHYMIMRGKPYLWVQEGDVHNMVCNLLWTLSSPRWWSELIWSFALGFLFLCCVSYVIIC